MDLPSETYESRRKIPRGGVNLVQLNVIIARHGISPGHNQGSHSLGIQEQDNCSDPGRADNNGGSRASILFVAERRKSLWAGAADVVLLQELLPYNRRESLGRWVLPSLGWFVALCKVSKG